jgi:hydrogenase expression/formation protein HypC
MCLAIPSKIIEIEDSVGIIDVDGIKREADISLLENPKVGDYVIVHAGFAIDKIDELSAIETINQLKKLAEAGNE